MPYFWNDDQTLEVSFFFNYVFYIINMRVSSYKLSTVTLHTVCPICSSDCSFYHSGDGKKISVPNTIQNKKNWNNLNVVTKLFEDGFFKEKKRMKKVT